MINHLKESTEIYLQRQQIYVWEYIYKLQMPSSI